MHICTICRNNVLGIIFNRRSFYLHFILFNYVHKNMNFYKYSDVVMSLVRIGSDGYYILSKGPLIDCTLKVPFNDHFNTHS